MKCLGKTPKNRSFWKEIRKGMVGGIFEKEEECLNAKKDCEISDLHQQIIIIVLLKWFAISVYFICNSFFYFKTYKREMDTKETPIKTENHLKCIRNLKKRRIQTPTQSKRASPLRQCLNISDDMLGVELIDSSDQCDIEVLNILMDPTQHQEDFNSTEEIQRPGCTCDFD